MDIVIFSQYLGLGDHLCFSTLPEEFSKLGHQVYVSNKSNYRNNEIFDLVWRMNPYVKGISDKFPNAGQYKWYPEGQHIEQNETTGFIGCMEMRHGLPKTNKYPKIYYEYKYLEYLKNTCVIDMNCITRNETIKDNQMNLLNLIESIVVDNNYTDLKIIYYKNIENTILDILKKFDKIYVNSIYDLCDILNSCKAIICPHSGNSSLASAIKQERDNPVIHCIKPYPHFETWHIHGYDNMNLHTL